MAGYPQMASRTVGVAPGPWGFPRAATCSLRLPMPRLTRVCRNTTQQDHHGRSTPTTIRKGMGPPHPQRQPPLNTGTGNSMLTRTHTARPHGGHRTPRDATHDTAHTLAPKQWLAAAGITIKHTSAVTILNGGHRGTNERGQRIQPAAHDRDAYAHARVHAARPEPQHTTCAHAT